MESTLWQPMDQASGLRKQVQSTRAVHKPVPVPMVHVHLLLGRGTRIVVDAGTLVWHWREHARPATGWDLQARLHVVGTPDQFTTAQLNKWRSLFPDWHFCGDGLGAIGFADVGWLWLGTGESLTALLRPVLSWLCRNRPDLPIIFAGLEGTTRERLERWASARFPLRYLQVHHLPSGVERTHYGYYKLFQRAVSPLAR